MNSAIKESRTDRIFKIINYFFLTVALLMVLYPLIYVLGASISNPTLVNSGEMWLFPKEVTWEGYKLVFSNPDIWRGYGNTIFYTTLGTLINLAVTLPAAYALSRKDFVGRNVFTFLLVLTMFFDGGLIPTYLIVKKLGLINTFWALVLPNAAAVWNIVISRVFFQSTIPQGLEEAARIDGANNFKLFFKIILPLSMPIVAVMALFYGVGHWNSYFDALIYLSDKKMYPLQLVLRQILVLQELSAGVGDQMNDSIAEMIQDKAALAAIMKYAVMIIATLPLVIVYPFLQRYFVKGVMIGSLKG